MIGGTKNLENGTRVNLGPGMKPELRDVKFSETISPDKKRKHIQIQVPSLEWLARHMDDFAARMGLTPEKLLKSLETAKVSKVTQYMGSGLPILASWDMDAVYRSVTKSMLVYWALKTDRKNIYDDGHIVTKQFVSQGAEALPWAYKDVPISLVDDRPDPFSGKDTDPNNLVHTLSVWSDGTGRIIGHFRIFGHVGITSILGIGLPSPPGGFRLAQNPLSGAMFQRDLKIDSIPESSWPDNRGATTADLQRMYGQLLKRVNEMNVGDAHNDVAEEIVSSSIGPIGTTFTAEDAERLGRNIIQEAKLQASGGSRSAELDGKELAKRLREILSKKKNQD